MNAASGPVALPVAGSSTMPRSLANIREYAPAGVGVNTKTQVGSCSFDSSRRRGNGVDLGAVDRGDVAYGNENLRITGTAILHGHAEQVGSLETDGCRSYFCVVLPKRANRRRS